MGTKKYRLKRNDYFEHPKHMLRLTDKKIMANLQKKMLHMALRCSMILPSEFFFSNSSGDAGFGLSVLQGTPEDTFGDV